VSTKHSADVCVMRAASESNTSASDDWTTGSWTKPR